MIQHPSSCYEEQNFGREAPSVGEESEGGRNAFIGADAKEVGVSVLSSLFGEEFKLLNEGTHGRLTPLAPHT